MRGVLNLNRFEISIQLSFVFFVFFGFHDKKLERVVGHYAKTCYCVCLIKTFYFRILFINIAARTR